MLKRRQIRRTSTKTTDDPPIPTLDGPNAWAKLSGDPITDVEKVIRRLDTVSELGTLDRNEAKRLRNALVAILEQMEWMAGEGKMPMWKRPIKPKFKRGDRVYLILTRQWMTVTGFDPRGAYRVTTDDGVSFRVHPSNLSDRDHNGAVA